MTYKEQLSEHRLAVDKKISYTFNFLTDNKGAVEINDEIGDITYNANFFIVQEMNFKIYKPYTALVIKGDDIQFQLEDGTSMPEMVYDLIYFLTHLSSGQE